MRRLITLIADACSSIAITAKHTWCFAAKYRKYRRLGNVHIIAWRLARDQQ